MFAIRKLYDEQVQKIDLSFRHIPTGPRRFSLSIHSHRSVSGSMTLRKIDTPFVTRTGSRWVFQPKLSTRVGYLRLSSSNESGRVPFQVNDTFSVNQGCPNFFRNLLAC